MIRDATPADIPTMVQIGRAMHQESVFAPFEFNENKVHDLMASLIHSQRGIALVLTDNDQIVGGFLGAVHEHWFGTELQASDYALFILPSHRGGTGSLRLLKEFVRQARAAGAVQITVGNSTGFEPERVKRLFEMAGFSQIGFNLEYTG